MDQLDLLDLPQENTPQVGDGDLVHERYPMDTLIARWRELEEFGEQRHVMISGVDDAGRAVWIDDPIHLAWISICAVAAMFAFAAGLQGWFARACKGWERLALFAVAFAMFRPGFLAPYIPLMGRIEVQALALALLAVIYLWQRRTAGPDRRPAAAR